MATNSTTPATAPDLPALEPDAPAVEHDRAVTNVGAGRITFKGHSAKAGYPFRIWEGQVQALVGDTWVDAPDAQAVES